MDKQQSSRTCFLCGRENPIGLKLSWYSDREARQVVATVTVPEAFNGYPGIVHGGIVAALLDETAGRALLIEGDEEENLFVTLKMEVTYRRPTPTGQPLTAIGWVLSRTRSRARVAAELRLPDGTVTARGQALVASPGDEFRSRWEPEKQYWKVYDE